MKLNGMLYGANNITCAVMKIEKKEGKNGSVYSAITVADGETQVDTKMWTAPEMLNFEAGTVIKAVIEKNVFNDADSYLIKKAEPTDESADPYFPHAPIDPKAVTKCILATIGGMKCDSIRNVTTKVFEDNKEKFERWTAAKKVHHNYLNGLAYHTGRMLVAAKMLAKVYPKVNTDVLFSALILHDMAKIREYDMDVTGASTVSVDGNLFGHLVMGAEMVNKAAYDLGIDPEKDEGVKLVKHCILAHHGQLEYGSPVKPAIKEAMLLHELDMIDAQMWQFETEEGKLSEGGVSDPVFGLGSRVYKPMTLG